MGKKQSFLKRTMGIVLAAALCICGWMPSEIKAEAAVEVQAKADRVIAVPYIATRDDYTTNTVSDAAVTAKLSAAASKVTALKVKAGALAVSYDYEASKGKSALKAELYADAACQKKVASVTGANGLGAFSKVVKAGTYYLKFVGKSGVKFDFHWYALSYPKKMSISKAKPGQGYFFYQQAGETLTTNLTIPNNGEVWLEYNPIAPMSETSNLQVFDASGKKILNEKMFFYDSFMMKKGTYTVKMSGTSGVYLFATNYKKYGTVKNTAKSKAAVLKTGKAATGALFLNGSKKDALWYQFTLKKDAKNKIKIANKSYGKEVKYQVFRGKKVISSGTMEPYIADDVVTKPTVINVSKKGTYYIKIYKKDSTTNAAIKITRVRNT